MISVTPKIVISLAVAAVGFAPAASAQAQVPAAQGRAITLDEAIELAARNHPAVIQARGNLEVSEATRLEYYGEYLPSITGTSSFSTNSSSRFDQATQHTISNQNQSYSTGFNASLVLFNSLRRSGTGRVTQTNIETAEAGLVDQRFQVVLQTKQTFFTALAAEELVAVAETQIARAESQLRISRDKLNAGSAIRSDTLRSFVELSNARLQLVNALTQRATAAANLARLVGSDEPVVATGGEAELALVSVDTTELRLEAMSNSPAIQQAEAQIRLADAQITQSRAGYFPRVTASYSQSWAGAQVSSLANTWSARLSLSWPIFNGFTRELGMTQSRIQSTTATAEAEDRRRQISAQLTQQLAALESARIRLDIAQASHAAAEEDLRVQQERYRLGASTIIDVLASQVSLDQAEVDIVQSRLDYSLAKAEIEALIGREI